MDYGLYVAASGADTQSRRLEVISNNLANVDTVGFKGQFALLESRSSRAVLDGADPPGSGGLSDLSSGVSLAETTTDFSHGTYRTTGAKWDMAIKREGFFLVHDRQHNRNLLTRAGNFDLNTQGELLTPQGYQVLDVDGSPIVVDPLGPAEVRGDGWILHASGAQRMAVVRPQSLGDLARAGDNTFFSLGPLRAVPPQDHQVEPGVLENSGVSATQSMMELIETSRMYEANVKMIQNHDQMTGSLINRVLTSR